MRNKIIGFIGILWFILVNSPQFFPLLNRIEPYVFGLPFNLFWIWSLNLLMTAVLIFAALKVWNTPDIDVEALKQLTKEKGLEVNNL